jgi:hypothetical protein
VQEGADNNPVSVPTVPATVAQPPAGLYSMVGSVFLIVIKRLSLVDGGPLDGRIGARDVGIGVELAL